VTALTRTSGRTLTLPDDATLIAAAKLGDPAALRALYDRHAGRVYAVVRRIAPEESLADDWAQETWVRAFRALPAFRGESSFGTWILRIAMNSAMYEARKLTRRWKGEVALDPATSATERPSEPVLRVRLERALAELPEGMRRILVLHDVEGYNHEEIAAILGNTSSTCRSQLFKARARMRELLSQQFPLSKQQEEPCPT
jgi:RNA polymerase sigma-70 factor (ECF subfamily)